MTRIEDEIVNTEIASEISEDRNMIKIYPPETFNQEQKQALVDKIAGKLDPNGFISDQQPATNVAHLRTVGDLSVHINSNGAIVVMNVDLDNEQKQAAIQNAVDDVISEY